VEVFIKLFQSSMVWLPTVGRWLRRRTINQFLLRAYLRLSLGDTVGKRHRSYLPSDHILVRELGSKVDLEYFSFWIFKLVIVGNWFLKCTW
jgi:hypothetical protein